MHNLARITFPLCCRLYTCKMFASEQDLSELGRVCQSSSSGELPLVGSYNQSSNSITDLDLWGCGHPIAAVRTLKCPGSYMSLLQAPFVIVDKSRIGGFQIISAFKNLITERYLQFYLFFLEEYF